MEYRKEAYRGVGREGKLPLGAKIVQIWIYLASKLSLVYIFQVEKWSMHAEVSVPFVIFHPKCGSK